MIRLSHTEDDIKKMLDVIGKESIESLFDSIPNTLKLGEDDNGGGRGDNCLKLPGPLTEWELEEYFESLSSKGFKGNSFLGGGSYFHHIPHIIPYLTSRSEFLTAYTPYQPEISQGTLQALFEYQTYISEYLGMDCSNASMYDGATSFVEAVLLSVRVTKRKKVLVSEAVNPHYREVLNTYGAASDLEIITLTCNSEGKTQLPSSDDLKDVASISVQSPNFFGVIEDSEKIKPIIGDEKTLFISVFSEILAFGLINPAGKYDADIVCGEAQSFGINRNFGGPGLGVFAFRQKFLRNVPGRLVGETVDKEGKRSFCLTLATREQHIRRDKATSNICSNHGLCALSALIYMSLLGGDGLKKLARINYNNCHYLKEKLLDIGCEFPFSGPVFNEFVVKFPVGTELKDNSNIIPGLELTPFSSELESCFLVTVTEVFSKKDLDDFVSFAGGIK